MIQLVKHFLRRVGLRLPLCLNFFAVMFFVGNWQLAPSKFDQAWFMGFMMATGFGMVMAIWTMQADEFDLVLPFRRRTLYLAQNLAALFLVVSAAVPVTTAALAVAVFRGDQREALRPCATFALIWIAMLLMALPLVRLAKRTRRPFAILIAVAMMTGFCFSFMIALKGKIKITSFPPEAVAVLAAALAWFLARRQFERYELIPSGDAGPAQGAAARSGVTDRFSPMVRVLAHALWLRWWFPVVLVFVALYCVLFTFTALKQNEVWVFYLAYAGCGSSILQLCSRIGQSLLPFVSRRTILRSVLAPIVAAPLLIGGVEAIAADSVQMIIRGLAMALVTVGMTWFALPSAKEYGRPFRVRLRQNLSLIPCLGFFACAFVPAARNFIARLFTMTWSHAAPWVDGQPVLASCVIVLATALLWWRCERKFRYFEPFAFPSGFRSAA